MSLYVTRPQRRQPVLLVPGASIKRDTDGNFLFICASCEAQTSAKTITGKIERGE